MRRNMTPPRVKGIRRALGFSQEEFARPLCVTYIARRLPSPITPLAFLRYCTLTQDSTKFVPYALAEPLSSFRKLVFDALTF